MIPYAGYMKLVAQSLTLPKLGPLDELRIPMQVSLGDVELTRMNNGRYVTLMDLGRTGIALRCGLLPAMLKRRWTPLVSAVSIRYRRSLRLGQHYELVTRVAAFDEKYWYFDQRFESGGEICTSAFVKALFFGPHGAVPSREMLEAANVTSVVSPPIPSAITEWLTSLEAMREAVTGN